MISKFLKVGLFDICKLSRLLYAINNPNTFFVQYVLWAAITELYSAPSQVSKFRLVLMIICFIF